MGQFFSVFFSVRILRISAAFGRNATWRSPYADTVSDDRIRFQSPQLPGAEEISEYFRLSEADRWYSNRGPCHRLLEHRLAAYVGPQVSALPVANCTVGLSVALRAASSVMRRRGRVVIMPAYTFIASASAVLWAGYVPLFVDVDPTSWQMDASALEHALALHHDDVAAVLGCSTFGTPAPHELSRAWEQICGTFRVPLVFDSAAGFGAVTDHGRRIGARGEAEVFSFHATKPFAIGEGGVITSRNADMVEAIGRLVNFGFDEEHHVMDIGLNAKMSELHAATALAVLDRYDQILAERRRMALRLHRRLAHHGFDWQDGFRGSTFQFVPVLARDREQRDRIMSAAPSARIEVRSYFDTPLHRYRDLRHHDRHGALRITEALAGRTLSLPMANDLSDDGIERIGDLCTRCALTPACL